MDHIANSLFVDRVYKALDHGDRQDFEKLLKLPHEQLDLSLFRDLDGSTLLHLAAKRGWLDATIDLTIKYNCDPNCKDSKGRTSLHYSAYEGNLEVTKYFVEVLNCDPMARDLRGWTALHWACFTMFDTKVHVHVSTGKQDVARYLLSTGKVDPLAMDRAKYTPVDIASWSYELIKLFEPFQQCRVEFPVHTYTKLVLTGYSGAGKTTISHLILLLASRSNSFFSPIASRVADVECLTAGIIPHHIESKVNKVGNMVLYDFAGQQEYYSSHAAVLEHVMQKSAAIFVCAVDISQCMENISESIHYWISFIENACSSAQGLSQIIIVGSHADLVKSSLELKEKSLLVESIANSRVKQLAYRGFVSMDCRLTKAKSTHNFLGILSATQQAIEQPSINFYCHMLYAFLCTKLRKIGCTLQELITALSSDKDFSPDSTVLIELLTSLSDKGLILFVQNQEHSLSSWVVVKKEALMRDVNGTLFASNHFKHHYPVASNTGIVPIMAIEKLFPQYEIDVLVGCLESMEFCHQVEPSALSSTSASAVVFSSSHSGPGSGYLFFPCLVKEHRPGALPTPRFGWCLGCSDPYQFFSNRFLHVLLLRLAFTFPLASKHLPPSSSLYGLERQCQVWQNGICWKSVSGVSTMVEVIDRNRWVIVLVSKKSREAAVICSSVIRLILDLQQQLCRVLTLNECLISPSLLDCYPFDALPDTDLFDLPAVARSMLHRHELVLDQKEGKNEFRTNEALLYEPYYLLQPSSVCQIFKKSIASQPVHDALLQEVLRYCQQPQRKPQDYKELREHVNKHSLFAGRNPLEVAGLKEEDLSSDPPGTAAVSSSTLSIDDLFEVEMSLQNVIKWQRLGLALGLLYPTLERIEEEQRGAIDKCKTKMIAAWLEQQDNVSKNGDPSWVVLQTALLKIGEGDKIII